MSQATVTPQQRFRGRLARSVLLTLLPLSLAPVLLLGSLISYYSYRLLRDHLANQLSTTVQAQAHHVETRVRVKEEFLDHLSGNASFNINLDHALRLGPTGPGFSAAREGLLTVFENSNRVEVEPFFDDFLVVLPDATVLIATNRDWEGKKLAGSPAFVELLQTNKSLAVIDVAPLYDQRFLILTSRLYANEGAKAVLIGITESLAAERILETSETIHQAAKAYIYTAKDASFTGFGESQQDLMVLHPVEGHKAALMPYLTGSIHGGTAEFTSFNNQPVIAFIMRLTDIEAGLVVEVPQNAIFSQLYSLIPYMIAILLATLIILGTIIGLGVRRQVNPILALTETTRRFAEGDWNQRAFVSRNDEIGLLAYTFNHMADELTALYRSMETKVEERTREMRTASEVAQIATSAPTLKELLQRTVHLIVERFGYYDASVFLIDESGEYAVLSESAGEEAANHLEAINRLQVGSQSMVGWVTQNKQPRVAPDVALEPLYLKDERLPNTRSEAVVPIAIGDRLLGALDIQSKELATFEPEDVAVIQMLANQIATAIQNVRLLEATQVNLEEASLLYHASGQVAKAETAGDVIQAVVNALKQTSHFSITLARKGNALQLEKIYDPKSPNAAFSTNWDPILPEEIHALLPAGNPLLVDDFSNAPKIPKDIFEAITAWKCKTAAFIPVMKGEELGALFVLASEEKEALTSTSIQPFCNLAELTTIALEKVHALQEMETRLRELQTLNIISEAISGQTDLYSIYQAVHDAVDKSMGKVNFLIAIYDDENKMIHVPYMFEGSKIITIDPFPLGEGLTSILINTRQPLMLGEDIEAQMKVLGAKIIGLPAKSWLGAPLITGGEVVGAIVVQDLEVVGRFNQNDLRLLTTIGAQVAAAIRNVRLLEHSRNQAERERLLHEVTRKIRSSRDMNKILATTVDELGKTLGMRRARIEIVPESQLSENGSDDGYESGVEAEEDEQGGLTE